MIEDFFIRLKENMESHSRLLKGGKLFLPEYLEGRIFTKTFPPVVHSLAKSLDLDCTEEVTNEMPDNRIYECGDRQRVDFVLEKSGELLFFLELESMDRSQLWTFWEYEEMDEEYNENKLWYYYGTIVNRLTFNKQIPRYLVFLLVLPDRRVDRYQVWDLTKGYEFLHPELLDIICENPYRFYDHLIKSAARLFIERGKKFQDPKTKEWVGKNLVQFQDTCELVFITCTCKHLILSRGKDLFDPEKEKRLEIYWTR